MHFQYDPHGYASALLTLEKTNMASHIAMAASGKKNDLLHRIEVIMGIQKSVSFSFYKLAGVFAGLVCILALQALFIMSKPQKQVADDFALLNVTNPWYFFMGNDYKEKEAGPASELPFLVTNEASRQEENIPHTAINVPATPTEVPGSPIAADPDPAPAPEYIYVNSKEILAPELTPEQEMQVEEIIENSKEVLEKAKWSQIEQEMADAVTSDEKLLIYEAYLAELEKVNWDKMEERLKLSVENVDLNKMSQQLQTEINVYKMDSLVKVYNTTLNALDRLESYVITNQSQEVIHPELTVELIQAKKKQMAAQSEKVRAIRDRKIIRL